MKQSFPGKSFLLSIIFLSAGIAGSVRAQMPLREKIRIPDVPGYVTLKCDFHMHTVYSDGEVLPTVRVEEAWRNGLDAISITDHFEYFLNQADIQETLDKLYRPARSRALALDLTSINGTELTLDMPPGHFSAIFLRDTGALKKPDWTEAIKAAHDQGAFIFWNHPGWVGQQPDGVARWYPEHTELLEKGLFHGIEIVTGNVYYPEAHRWCLEHGLTMLGNSDIHEPLAMVYDFASGEHRPVTLVFARDHSGEAIRDALLSHRTAVYWKNTLIGEERFLRPIFENSIQVINPDVPITAEGFAYIQILNDSDVSYELTAGRQTEGISVPQYITLVAGKTVLLGIMYNSEAPPDNKSLNIPYTVENLRISPEAGLPVEFKIKLTFKNNAIRTAPRENQP